MKLGKSKDSKRTPVASKPKSKSSIGEKRSVVPPPKKKKVAPTVGKQVKQSSKSPPKPPMEEVVTPNTPVEELNEKKVITSPAVTLIPSYEGGIVNPAFKTVDVTCHESLAKVRDLYRPLFEYANKYGMVIGSIKIHTAITNFCRGRIL